MTGGGMPVPRSLPSLIGGAKRIDTMRAIPTQNVSGATQGAEHVIVELTQRLADREGEIRSILQQKAALETYLHTHQFKSNAEAYDQLLTSYVEREEQLRNATEANEQMDKKIKELEKLARELQNNIALLMVKLSEKEEKIAKLVKLEVEIKSNRAAVLEAEDVIKKEEGAIKLLNKERDELSAKSKEADKKTKKLENELSSYQELLEKSKSLAEEQINVLLENEKTISGLEGKNAVLEKVIESLKEQLKKNTRDIKSKDALLNMRRQELGAKEHLIEMYETKFDAKNVDIPQIVARANEGERIWAKIEEREKKFAAKEIMIQAFRDENTSLQAEKKRLQGEVDELKSCFELYELKLNGTNDKVHMPWLLAQLRDSVALKEKVVELEEIIHCEGYTIKAKEAENSYKEKENEMKLEMAKVSQIIETLKGQTAGVQDMEVPVLLGKLEECLNEFDEDGRPIDDIMSQILSTASSDINRSSSLNTNSSFAEDRWAESMCLSTRDFKDLMRPDHIAIVTSLVTGFGSLKSEGLCSSANHNEDNDDDEELGTHDDERDDERDDIVDTPASVDEDKGEAKAVEKDEGRGGEADKDDFKPDIHIEKVFKILHKNDTDPEDWRRWIIPQPTSCNGGPTAE